MNRLPRISSLGGAVLATVLNLQAAMSGPARTALESGDYQTVSGATVEEIGDWVPKGKRVVPISAVLSFDIQ